MERFRRRAIFFASARRIRSTITSSSSSITAASSPITTRDGSASWIWRRAAQLADHPRLSGLGAEPLAPDFDANCLAKLFAGARTSLKAALLDQKRIAGLGNIYVCEALFRARLAPTRPAGILADARGAPTRAAAAIVEAIRNVLEEAIEAGGSTLRDHRQANGELGYFQHVFKVYDREGLRCVRERCRGIIARTVHSGRSTFYCAICQR